MNVIIEPCGLRGSVETPSSKSVAHRMLIAASLSDAPTAVLWNARSNDMEATIQCLRALGARIEDCDGGVRVCPVDFEQVRVGEDALGGPPGQACILSCAESGSTLRFMLPVAAALGAACVFTGTGRLPERPNAPLVDALRAHGAALDSNRLPMQLGGRLRGGQYPMPANISSQYLTGLMLALPLCREDSEIRLTTALESAAYLDITRDVLARFGIVVEPAGAGYRIPGGQRYRSPGEVRVEGDWSAATFWLVANHLGHSVKPTGLNVQSAQGDRAVRDMLRRLGGPLDVSDMPDAVPALAVAAALHEGDTRFTGGARLRVKESDRIVSTCAMLRALGGRVTEHPDGLTVHGGAPLTGGTVDGCNDHRIVMAAAIAATVARERVTITDAEAVNKSYPAFFHDFNALGGKSHVE